ncbi:MAG: hypothetical protein EOO92_07175 [Pedobacter sp.]|nr:MAG: hypothetical protein EOO92_07175 [Pedobacter sp.]
MKRYIGILSLSLLMLMSCKKNDPITKLGSTNNEFASQLRVTYNNTRPAFGDTLVVSASTWQRDDKFQRVTIYETLIETIGFQLSLKNGTSIVTKTADESTLTLVDTLAKKAVAFEVKANDLDKYWVTSSSNYVINYSYKVEPKAGKYAEDASLITAMNDAEFAVLKGLLAYSITKNDYLAIFPAAPANHFTAANALTAVGMKNLRDNTTRAMLTVQVNSVKKIGNYNLTIDVNAVTPTNATTATTRTFDITLPQ